MQEFIDRYHARNAAENAGRAAGKALIGQLKGMTGGKGFGMQGPDDLYNKIFGYTGKGVEWHWERLLDPFLMLAVAFDKNTSGALSKLLPKNVINSPRYVSAAKGLIIREAAMSHSTAKSLVKIGRIAAKAHRNAMSMGVAMVAIDTSLGVVENLLSEASWQKILIDAGVDIVDGALSILISDRLGKVGASLASELGPYGAAIGYAAGSEIGTIGYFTLTEIMTIDGKTLPEHAKNALYDLFGVKK
jgi:hypothetical protein